MLPNFYNKMKNSNNTNGLEKGVMRGKERLVSPVIKNEGPKEIPKNFCVFGKIENQKVLWRFPLPEEK